MDTSSRLTRLYQRLLPQSLRAQFSLAFMALALLIFAGGITAIYALRTSNNATRHLVQAQLMRLQAGQDMLQSTLLIEHQTDQLLTSHSFDSLRTSYSATVTQLETLDRLVAQLTDASNNVLVLDLHQSSQLFRNSANVVAQLQESLLKTEAALSIASNAQDVLSLQLKLTNQRDTLQRFHQELTNQSKTLVDTARAQALAYSQEYQQAVRRLVETSNHSQLWVLVMLIGSLALAWFVARLFMGRHVLLRLNEISRQLRQGRIDEQHQVIEAQDQDEIGAMARAVSRFLNDRFQLEKRTSELGLVKERLALQNAQLQHEAVIRSGQGHVLEMIATSTALKDVLDNLAQVIESQIDGMMASVLLLDEDGTHLLHGAAPNLPQAYTEAIDGIAIGPNVGSCGTAAWRKKPVVVTDIDEDPLWADYREIAAQYGFRTCWSTPILSHDRQVLGTFALYALTVRHPTETESQLIDVATHLAGIAIERKRTEDRIRYMGDHDALTGLPNRSLLEDRLKQAILYAQRYSRLVTVAFIDLDKFKLVNDSLGHSAGDELLKTVANRMVNCVRRTDTVIRLGGDEFVIILFDQPSDLDDITEVLQKLQETILEPIHLSGHTLHVTCSMGLASYPADGIEPETLLRNADAAMYRSKELGRNGYQFYTHEMSSKHQGKLLMQDGLRNAIDQSQFLLLYQPQVDLRSGHVIGVEALIRWQHPELGLVSPIKFIPQAEETGLIVPIGDWVIRTACLQNKAWQDAGLPPIIMSVNISARQFIERDLVSRVKHALHDSGLEPRYLELELTESLIMQDLQQAITKMQELQAMGIRLSIDDFGTGYSSLAALKSFPIVRLKIDQSFVRDLPDNENDRAIATAVISLGHKLNLKVIAEGVETEQQRTFLQENGCDEMQGYLFSRPVPVEEIAQLLPRHCAPTTSEAFHERNRQHPDRQPLPPRH